MSEKDMINNGDAPGTEPSGNMPENFEQMLRQLGAQPADDGAELPKSEDSAAAPDNAAAPQEAQPSEHAMAADSILSAADEPAEDTSWLDNLLAFVGQNTEAAPDEPEQSVNTDIIPDLTATDNADNITANEALPAEDAQAEPDDAPTADPDADTAAEDTAEMQPDGGSDEVNIPKWVHDAIPEPQEINGPDWQSAFTVSDDDAPAHPEAEPIEDNSTAADEPAAEDSASTDEAAPVSAEPVSDATAEFIPAALSAAAPQTDSVIEDTAYESPKPAGKDKKAAKGFRIETDYRHDFGEYDRIHPIKLDKRHKTGCVGGILYFLFIIVTGALLGGMLWLAAADVLAINKPANDVEISIPEDFTIEQVADILHSNGLIKYKFLFKIFADFSSAEEKIDPGVYQLKTSYDYRALVSCMSTYSGYRVVTDVVIPEGYNQFQMFELLEKEGVCTQAQLWEAAETAEFDYDFVLSPAEGGKYRLEGYLFPDTYEFYINDDPVRVLNKMLSNFNNKFTEEYRLRAEELGYSIHDIVAIASMIEKETGVDSERATIGSVIYNRLASDDFPYLQIDATIIYATYVTGEEFSTALDSPYNTYLNEGLPNPITNPGIASIRAALYPETTNYYFYAATTDFTTRFFSRYDDFIDFVNSDEFQSSN